MIEHTMDKILELQTKYEKETWLEVYVDYNTIKNKLIMNPQNIGKTSEWYKTEALQRLKRVYEAERNK
jgi:hypothetical protein